MRSIVLALTLATFGCVATSSVTRTGTGLFAPHDNAAEDEDAPRGLSLSVESVAADGTATLLLRNYSADPFVFAGTPEHPRLVIEVQSGNTQSRHTVSPWGSSQTHEVPAGERLQLKAKIGGASGRVRIGIRSADVGYVVWTDWMAR